MSNNYYLVIFATGKYTESLPENIAIKGEGHSAAGWGIGRPVVAADCGVQSPFIRAMGCCYLRCAT